MDLVHELACAQRPAGVSAIRRGRSPGFVDEVLGEFERRGLIFRDGSLVVALAVPAVAGR